MQLTIIIKTWQSQKILYRIFASKTVAFTRWITWSAYFAAILMLRNPWTSRDSPSHQDGITRKILDANCLFENYGRLVKKLDVYDLGTSTSL
uniref:Uncharacterized protein n=1 Tax=Candidozyma auris TaxID=498019 RepID=A0A0L0NQ97_CANAR